MTDPGGMQAAFGELDEILAREHAPVVVAVKLTPTAFDSESGKAPSVKIGHFVLVTGKMANGDYSILDPAGKYSTLGGDKNYLGNDTWFQLNGYIKDPPGTSDLRAWASAPGEGVSVTLIDPQGRTTGFDPTTGMEFQEIPGSAQYFVAIADAVTGATADGLTHFIDALEPMAGMYTIVIRSNGVADVPYTISLGGDAIDGTEHNPLQIDGMARSGIADTFKIVLDPASFAQPTVVVPVLDPIPNVTVTQGTPVTFTAVAHDADPSAVLTFSLGAGAPAGASIDPSTGLFTWMPVDAPVVANILVIVSVNGTPVQNIGQYVKITVKSAIPVFTVTNTADSGAGSLRQAILNANIDPGPDTILFNIGPGTQTIVLQSPLPAITDQVFIDGESEPGFSEHPLIVLDGSSAGFGVDGLVLGSGSDGSKIRGIVVDRFKSAGLRIQSSHNTIQGDYFGVDATGETAAGNFYGLILASTASNNLIGAGADGNAGEGNVLSGNGQAGVALIGHGVTQNAISANHIGTDAGGSIAIRNGSYGVYIDGSSNNTVGGTTAGLGNVISGNGSFGIYMWDNATGNAVQGNYIGTDSTGTAALGNGFAGIYILSANNVIGGNQLGAGNVISANPYGLLLWEAAATGNLVAGNLIGTDCSGRKPLGNTFAGLYVYNADKNVIGGTTAAARNIISGNNGVGIVTAGTSAQNVFEGDYVGLDVKGDTPIPNLNIGVLIESPNNTIGGIAAGAGNVISGNGGVGLWIYGAGGGMGTTITGNYIGTDATGSKARGNAYQGIYIGASANNSIRSNVISGNGNNGIWIDGMAATGNVVQGNLIGVDVGGVAAIGNSFSGIVITAGSNNRIGGASPGDGNVIAANGNWGVWIDGSSASGNAVAGNHIGVLADGSTLMGNTFDGVALSRGASGNLIGGGTASAGNAIAGNFRDGVRVLDQSSSNTIRANSIFSNGGLGIDLNGDGVTPNDNEDGDTGANGLQNFPVIVAADPGIATQVMGSLNSTPNSVFTLDFYANAIPDSSGYGQGKRWIGSSTVTTDAAGKADFDLTFASATVPGEWITATATSADGSTSEFSRAALVTNPLSVKAGGDQAVNEGGLVSLSSASYTSISPPIQLGLQVDWGDGTVETGSLVPGTGEGTIANTHRYAEPGNYTVTLTLTDGVNPTVTDHLHVAVADAPTQLVSYVIQHDQTQRSFIRYLDLYFSDDDGLAGFLTGQGIQLVRYDANGLNPATVSLAGLVTVSGTHVSIDFGINGIGGNRLTNAGDGTYRLILSLHEQQSTTTVQFARLLGDVNGDGSVDAADYSLALGYVKTGDPNGDINGDGFIDMRDLMVIKLAQGRKIKPPA
ncbi:MAG TPA: NosD domain-containing protein [Pirellulales bacterium]|nr:NosD domain-containing protein [Pirellulales bacterium]